MYGSFPIWFEEGFAHFGEFYMTETLEDGVARNREDLEFLGFDAALYVGFYRDPSFEGYLAERMQGFLFMNHVYEMNGIDALIATVREIRTKSLSDQELLRVFVGYGTSEERNRMEEHFCQNVVGTSRNYCPPDKPF